MSALKRDLREMAMECDIKKGDQHLFLERQEKYTFMKFQQLFFPVEKMCKTLKISCSSYYNWKQNIDGKRSVQDEALLSEIKAIHKFSHETYGSPCIYKELKNKERMRLQK